MDAEKSFDRIQHPFMIKAQKKLGLEGTYLSVIKVIYHKPITDIALNRENLKSFPIK
jgi:hypothetical protein